MLLPTANAVLLGSVHGVVVHAKKNTSPSTPNFGSLILNCAIAEVSFTLR